MSATNNAEWLHAGMNGACPMCGNDSGFHSDYGECDAAPTTAYLTGSHGLLAFTISDGYIDTNASRYDTGAYRPIVRIDVAEYRAFYGRDFAASIDILDVGYWYLDEHGNDLYEPPALEWRKEFRPV